MNIASHFRLDKRVVSELKLDNKNEELFKLLILKQCQQLHSVMPQLFETISDYSDLLFPQNNLMDTSFMRRLVNEIDEEDFKDITILGWLYQYYISEKKNEIYKAKKTRTKEEIPAVTALYTPSWIVKYMVQNSLGRLWLEGHPNTKLQNSYEYYLEEAEQTIDVQKQLDEIKKQAAKLSVEEITFLEPCCGSGHILIEAFDIFYNIYESLGYYYEDIPSLIIKNNLIGLDIDDRSVQLASLSLTMKALGKDKSFLSKNVQPRVYGFFDAPQIASENINIISKQANLNPDIISYLLETFKEAKTIGSLLIVKPNNYLEELAKFEYALDHNLSTDLENSRFLIDLYNLADILSSQYDVVVTNPPYMGREQPAILKSYLGKNYPNSKSDLMATFMEKIKT